MRGGFQQDNARKKERKRERGTKSEGGHGTANAEREVYTEGPTERGLRVCTVYARLQTRERGQRRERGTNATGPDLRSNQGSRVPR